MLDRSITLPLTTENNIFNCDKNPKDHFRPVLKFSFFFFIMIYLYNTSISKISDLITPKMSILSTSKTTPYSRTFSRVELLAYLLILISGDVGFAAAH